MHGIMEGPGEEVTVAAVATDGDHHHHHNHHHHHHNGVSASMLANGGASKDIPSPDVPPARDGGVRDATPTPVQDAPAESVTPPGSLKSESTTDKPEEFPKNAKEEDALLCAVATVAEKEEKSRLEEASIATVETKSENEVPSVETEPKIVESEPEPLSVSVPVSEPEPETEKECKKSTEDTDDSIKGREGESESHIKIEESYPDPEAEDGTPDETPAEGSDKEDTSNVSQGDEPLLDSSETSEASVKESSSVSDQEVRMEVDDVPQDSAKLKVDEESAPSSEKLPDTEGNLPAVVAQKRSSDETLCDSQAKKQCLPDIVCNDASALDLSSIRKKDSKEPKIALKPQSLLLSKLQGDSDADKLKQDSQKKDTSKGPEPNRPNKIASSGARSERRRSSREEKERSSHHGKHNNDISNNRIAERDQVLREMRDKVLNLYKERDRVAKEDSLLRDLLEPERDTLLTELVEAATLNGGIPELERVSGELEADIRVLNVEICNKEAEWNELIRKRKLKEELALRVQRRKQVLVLAGECEEEFSRQNSFDGESRLDLKRDSQLEARHDHREMPPKSGQELLAAALRLGSRNIEDYHHQRGGGSSPLAVRIQARANELLTGSTPYERKSSGLPPGLSHMPPQSLLQSQLSKPSEISPTSPQSQFLLQHLQRQRALMGGSGSGSACHLSSSVSLSALPTSTTTSPALSTCLPSAATNNKNNSSRMDKQMTAPGGPSRSQQRPILPKPISAASGHAVSDASLDATGGGIIGEGRQGPILDVKSIIADYRSKHPEGVPRRGRRMKTSGMVAENMMSSARPGSSSGGSLLSMSLPALGSGSQVRTGLHGGVPVDLSELGFVLTSGAGSDGPSRPSSTESTLSGVASQMNQDNGTGMSFKDVLVQFAKMTNVGDQNSLAGSGSMLGRGVPPQPHYPEVTLHPVVSPASVSSPTSVASSPTTSLLHGILTKSNSTASQALAKPTTFSPTLARLLTAPERSSSSSGGGLMSASQVSSVPSFGPGVPGSNYPPTGPVLLSDLLSGSSPSKTRSELTITPVTASSAMSTQMQSLASVTSIRGKQEVVVLDGEDVNGEDGDADTDSDERRLIIDEGDGAENGEVADGESSGTRQDRTRATVPHCQGCNERDAEFVCAGCQRQWYCSRECQIAAWDEHSEVCFPPSAGATEN